MKIFLIKSAVFVVLVSASLILIAGLKVGRFGKTNDYMEAMIDKHIRLHSLNPPRIILVGGSSFAFGINSGEIEKAIGIPVVNMGLHAGLGLFNILNEVKADIRKGDVVILCVEYGTKEGETELINKTIELYPEASSFLVLPGSEKNLNFRETFYYIIGKVQKPVNNIIQRSIDISGNQSINNDPIYRRSGFNSYGDVVSHLNHRQPDFLEGKGIWPREDYHTYIKMMNDMAMFVKLHQARIYFAYPPYPQSEYKVNKDLIDSYIRQYETGLHIQVLNNYQDFIYPDKYFFNTIFHLNAEGREKRTHELIIKLKEVI